MVRRLEGLKRLILYIILLTFINWIGAVDDVYAITRDSLVGKARQCCVDRYKHADKRYGW
jgi:hypothetical protein